MFSKYNKPEKNKRSFFEKLIGAGADTEEAPEFAEYRMPKAFGQKRIEELEEQLEEEMDGELAVDAYETDNDIIIQAMVAGVRPEELQINIAPEYVTIAGSRTNAHEVSEENFLYKELYWGSFSRTIPLPKQIEPDMAQAVEKHGLLILRLPKLDKEKTYRIKIKSAAE